MVSTLQIGELLPPEGTHILHYISPILPKRLTQEIAPGVHSNITGNASTWESIEVHEPFSIMNPFGRG